MPTKPVASLFAAIALSLFADANAQASKAPSVGEYAMVIRGEDWGPAVTKLVVRSVKAVSPAAIRPGAFSVAVRARHFDPQARATSIVVRERAVTNAYPSDGAGNRLDAPSEFIALELPFHPADPFSNPFFYDFADNLNKWKDPLEFTVKSDLLSAPASRLSGRLCPEADAFRTDSFKARDVRLSYAWYEPEGAGKRPLIVWLHGAGEGGHDPVIALLGNKVTALASAKIQGAFGGAYVLVPQSPLVWMTQGGKPYDINGKAKSSMYSEAVEELIRAFVSSHAGVDPDRVYLGGCSNGGYMTVNLVLRNPGYFAAAFPVCEAYPDAWLSKRDIARLAKERLWFTASALDRVVNPAQYILPTVKRLRAAGGRDIHMSYFDAIEDRTGRYEADDGKPYRYDGHWAWIPVLNDECEDGGLSLMSWLASRPGRR